MRSLKSRMELMVSILSTCSRVPACMAGVASRRCIESQGLAELSLCQWAAAATKLLQELDTHEGRIRPAALQTSELLLDHPDVQILCLMCRSCAKLHLR